MKFSGILWFMLLGALLLPWQKAAADGIADSYQGRYQCGDWHKLDLLIRDLGGGRISAVFTFSVSPGMGGGEGAYSMAGLYDERTGQFQLTPQVWLVHARNATMVGLIGVYDRASRTLRGRVPSFNCGAFELASRGVALAAVPQPPRPLPLERRKVVSNLTNDMPRYLEYWDSAMDDPHKSRESEPIDDVIDWLKSQDFWCLGTKHVSWNPQGTQGVAYDHNDVRERYVIECDGNCAGLRYMPWVDATIYHFGATQPVPVLELKGVWLNGRDFQWKFTRPASGPPPEVYVHRWSSAKILSGQNCRAPETNNR
jgi:hypothetical protein